MDGSSSDRPTYTSTTFPLWMAAPPTGLLTLLQHSHYGWQLLRPAYLHFYNIPTMDGSSSDRPTYTSTTFPLWMAAPPTGLLTLLQHSHYGWQLLRPAYLHFYNIPTMDGSSSDRPTYTSTTFPLWMAAPPTGLLTLLQHSHYGWQLLRPAYLHFYNIPTMDGSSSDRPTYTSTTFPLWMAAPPTGLLALSVCRVRTMIWARFNYVCNSPISTVHFPPIQLYVGGWSTPTDQRTIFISCKPNRERGPGRGQLVYRFR